MQAILKKQFIIIILPAVGLFLVFGLARELNFIKPGQFVIPSVMHSLLFILSVITAIAGPLFFRTLFAHSMRKQTRVPAKEFLSFQKKILWLSLITPYLAFTAVLCDFPRFYSAAIVLMALYAVYYYFPSQKRIDFDRKIFRVK
ncbi:MAG: hypothetical protein KOO65_08265 [Desulfobacterales bacterium]|nr:hypothetical protein [Desulfobacterales bacterium]MBU8911249.1 hypothetical protein [Desulfobacterales bacterium]